MPAHVPRARFLRPAFRPGPRVPLRAGAGRHRPARRPHVDDQSPDLRQGRRALVHARGRIAMEWMIHHGYCHGVITGNAVAVHDVEAALYGTTLGMRADGTGQAGGHTTHMRAINEVKKAGSVRALVDAGRLTT